MQINNTVNKINKLSEFRNGNHSGEYMMFLIDCVDLPVSQYTNQMSIKIVVILLAGEDDPVAKLEGSSELLGSEHQTKQNELNFTKLLQKSKTFLFKERKDQTSLLYWLTLSRVWTGYWLSISLTLIKNWWSIGRYVACYLTDTHMGQHLD